MNWFRQTLADYVGTQEPEYGPSAIQSVTQQAEETPYTELTKDDLKWKAMEVTNVETQTFYIITDEGKVCSLQVLYSNVAGLHTTVHFNVKIFNHHGDALPQSERHLWCSDPLENYGFDEQMLSFYADGVAVTLNEAGDSFNIKSARNEDTMVNVDFTRTGPGFQVGKNGTSFFGTDPANPWGQMRHRFWPRCSVTGKIVTKEKEYDLTGKGLFIHALQGMKPHHAAARWNFITFQAPTYSAVMMEYTTPASYGSSVVNVGGIVKDGEILYAGATNTAKHLESKTDEESQWPEPTAAEFQWQGKTKDDQEFAAVISGPIGERQERVDVMSHVPGLVKTLVGGVVGTRPYIFQIISSPSSPSPMTLQISQNGTSVAEEKGTAFCEATFIS